MPVPAPVSRLSAASGAVWMVGGRGSGERWTGNS